MTLLGTGRFARTVLYLHYISIPVYFVNGNLFTDSRNNKSCIFIYKSLRVTPAMAAGVTDKLWTLEDVINEMDNYFASLEAK